MKSIDVYLSTYFSTTGIGFPIYFSAFLIVLSLFNKAIIEMLKDILNDEASKSWDLIWEIKLDKFSLVSQNWMAPKQTVQSYWSSLLGLNPII